MKFAPRVLDLFCGAGGMSLGFKNAGCKILGGIEYERWPAETHEKNFPECKLKFGPKDICDVEPSDLEEWGIGQHDVDILIGGPPCQGFSIVGQSKIRHLGLERERDRKNKLYEQYIKFLRYFKPKYFVIENVQGMKTFKKQNFLQNVLKKLRQEGYYVPEPEVLTASKFGVPQVRHRLFIIGRLEEYPDLAINYPKPTTQTPITLKEAISDLRILHAKKLTARKKGTLMNGGTKHEDKEITYKTPPNSKYQKKMRKGNGETVRNHICRGHNEFDLEIFDELAEGGRYIDLPEKYHRYRADIFKDKYRRLVYTQPSWTLTAHMQRDCLAYIHPTQKRTLSTREAARIQSFPDKFVFEGPMTKVFRQIGNAVPPLLAQAVAKPIVAELRKKAALEAATIQVSAPATQVPEPASSTQVTPLVKAVISEKVG